MIATRRFPLVLLVALPLLAGCPSAGGDDDDEPTPEPCAYPDGAVDPMELDEVLFPYSWDTAIHGDGTTASIDLDTMPCAVDEVIDWSPFDVLLFVSIPAW